MWQELEAEHSPLPIVRPLSIDPLVSAPNAVHLEVPLAHSRFSTVRFEIMLADSHTLARCIANCTFFPARTLPLDYKGCDCAPREPI
jgi:hypothetical protein